MAVPFTPATPEEPAGGPQVRPPSAPGGTVDASAADDAPVVHGERLLGRNDYTKLFAGQAISGLGDWMATTAFMALALDLTGSPTAVAGVLVVRLMPGLVAAPLGARASARWTARRTMLAMDAFRAVAIALVPFVGAIWWIYAWAFALEVASLVFLPARDASMPRLVSTDHLPLANGLILASSYATIPVGAGAFSAVSAFGGTWSPLRDRYGLVFWVDGATFVISFAFVAAIGALPVVRAVVEDAPPLHLRDALRIPIVRNVLPAAVGASIGLGALFSVGIVFVNDVLGASQAAFGLLVVAFGAGAVGGVLLVQQRARQPALHWARDGIRIAGASVLAISVLPGLLPAYAAAVVLGASVAYGLVGGISFLQATLAGPELTIAFTAFHVAIRLVLGAAALATGVAADVVPDVQLGRFGTVASPRLVLAAAGLVIVATTARVGRGFDE